VAQIVYLLEQGLDPNIGDCDDERPLDVLIGRAASARKEDDVSFFVDAIRALVAHDAMVNYSSVNEDGMTHYPRQPLQIAIKNNSRDIFDFLLRARPLSKRTARMPG
jgi:ankyrin repeat protein